MLSAWMWWQGTDGPGEARAILKDTAAANRNAMLLAPDGDHRRGGGCHRADPDTFPPRSYWTRPMSLSVASTWAWSAFRKDANSSDG